MFFPDTWSKTVIKMRTIVKKSSDRDDIQILDKPTDLLIFIISTEK